MSESPTTAAAPSSGSFRTGLCYGLAAYLSWGLFPIYFKTVAGLGEHDPTLTQPISSYELLSHRIVWAIPVLVALIAWKRRWNEVGAIFRSPGTFATLAITASLVAFNWLMYIWAVTSGHIVEASLGYFINPLVNVLYGVVFFKDRLSRMQKIGLALAAAGVLYLTLTEGRPPWISLGLAFSFATYGLLRKRTSARPIPGLLVETIVLLPIAAGYLVWQNIDGSSAFLSGSWRADALLLVAGAVTITPLVWFVEAAKRLTLSTIGFLQYLAPSGQFLLGVAVYGEPFTLNRAIAFGAIWSALALYSVGLVRSVRARRRSEKSTIRATRSEPA
ncbi:MAG: EamA family transporter RarD [Phycisphaerales bacterium]